MAHVRSQIRDRVVVLLNGLPATGNRVFSGRSRPLKQDHETCLLVYTTEEAAEYAAMGGVLLRELTLVVEGRAVAAEAADIEDTLDEIAEQVEPALLRAPPLGGFVRDIALRSTRITVQSPGESHAGEIQMSFRVVYRTRETAPSAAV